MVRLLINFSGELLVHSHTSRHAPGIVSPPLRRRSHPLIGVPAPGCTSHSAPAPPTPQSTPRSQPASRAGHAVASSPIPSLALIIASGTSRSISRNMSNSRMLTPLFPGSRPLLDHRSRTLESTTRSNPICPNASATSSCTERKRLTSSG
jgi:hypothetical protein